MKSKFAFTALILGLLSANALAGHNRHTTYARVIDVQPVYQIIERRTPREECWTETVRVESVQRIPAPTTSTIVGGIVGGAIGHAVGHGRDNRKLGAVVGSVLGASIGRDLSRNQQNTGYQTASYTEVSYRDVEHCEIRHSRQKERVLRGYDVTYIYHNRHYTTRMDRRPGRQIEVDVNIRPVRY